MILGGLQTVEGESNIQELLDAIMARTDIFALQIHQSAMLFASLSRAFAMNEKLNAKNFETFKTTFG